MVDKLSPSERAAVCNEHFPVFLAYYGREYISASFAKFHFDFMDDVALLAKPKPAEVLWCAFREAAKSAIAKWAVIWFIASRKKKNIIIASYREANSTQFALDVAKELAENPLMRRDYGVIYSKAREGTEITKKTAKEFECAGGIWLQASTVNIDPRGLLKGSQRPDLAVLDDFENNDTIFSKAETESIQNYFSAVLGAIDLEKGSVLYLGNYLSSIGNVAYIKNKLEKNGSPVRFIPAIVNGEPSWDRMTLDLLEAKKKSMGSLKFDTEYMLVPISDSTRVFKKEHFKYITWQELHNKKTSCYITVDPAFTKTERSDYTGIVINFLDEQGYWNIKSYQKKMTPAEFVEELFSLFMKYAPKVIMLEDFAYTAGLKPYIDSKMRELGVQLPIITTKSSHLASKILESNVSKESRIETALQPLYESGTIVHIVGECDDMEDQLVRHPINTHDDIIDALAYQRAIVPQANTGTTVKSYQPNYQPRTY